MLKRVSILSVILFFFVGLAYADLWVEGGASYISPSDTKSAVGQYLNIGYDIFYFQIAQTNDLEHFLAGQHVADVDLTSLSFGVRPTWEYSDRVTFFGYGQIGWYMADVNGAHSYEHGIKLYMKDQLSGSTRNNHPERLRFNEYSYEIKDGFGWEAGIGAEIKLLDWLSFSSSLGYRSLILNSRLDAARWQDVEAGLGHWKLDETRDFSGGVVYVGVTMIW